jgi:hypothetical protein
LARWAVDQRVVRGVVNGREIGEHVGLVAMSDQPGFVVIRHEMVHEARTIPLDRRPQISPTIQSYMGDPRGWWEGDTLVVETTDFNGRTGSYARTGDGNPTSTARRLVERFRLGDKDTLLHEVLVEDPRTWVAPWKVAFPIRRDESYLLHEYACHEGNYALRNISARPALQNVKRSEISRDRAGVDSAPLSK